MFGNENDRVFLSRTIQVIEKDNRHKRPAYISHFHTTCLSEFVDFLTRLVTSGKNVLWVQQNLIERKRNFPEHHKAITNRVN